MQMARVARLHLDAPPSRSQIELRVEGVLVLRVQIVIDLSCHWRSVTDWEN